MQVKKIVAKDIRSALTVVREELGPNAIILSNNKRNGKVELLCTLDAAALDEQQADKSNGALPTPTATIRAAETARRSNQVETDHKMSVLELELDSMQREQIKKAADIARHLQAKSNKRLRETSNAQALEEHRVEEPQISEYATVEKEMPFSRSENTVVNGANQTKREIAYRYEAPSADADQYGVDYKASSASKIKLGAVTDIKKNAEVNDEPVSAEKLDDWLNDPLQVDPMQIDLLQKYDTDESRLQDMSKELKNIWRLLQSQASNGFGQTPVRQQDTAMFCYFLNQLGITGVAAQGLLDSVPVQTVDQQEMCKQVEQAIPVMDDDIIDKGGVFAFVGASGVGKTATIGKLAANYVLKHGANDIVLVTTDNVRIAAHESLRAYGRILNVPVKVLENRQTLAALLHTLRKKSLVLIDTPGCHHRDPNLYQQVHLFGELSHRLNTLLVLPATAQLRVLEKAFCCFKGAALMGCVVTKMDEALSLGEIISLVIANNLPVAYLTDGQLVPDNISMAQDVDLVAEALKMSTAVPSHTSPNSVVEPKQRSVVKGRDKGRVNDTVKNRSNRQNNRKALSVNTV